MRKQQSKHHHIEHLKNLSDRLFLLYEYNRYEIAKQKLNIFKNTHKHRQHTTDTQQAR